MPALNLGDIFPNFEANTTQGRIKFHDFLGDKWGILFSHPRDYTPVCTTELARVVQLEPEFTKRNVKLIALSCDTVEDHNGWSQDILSCTKKKEVPYPIIDDSSRDLAVSLGMIDPEEKTSTGMPLTCRAVFIIAPDKKMKFCALYPATTGRNFTELLRLVDSIQLTAKFTVGTPADWKVMQSGEKCMVLPCHTTDEAKKIFKKGVKIQSVPSGKDYMRFTPDPR